MELVCLFFVFFEGLDMCSTVTRKVRPFRVLMGYRYLNSGPNQYLDCRERARLEMQEAEIIERAKRDLGENIEVVSWLVEDCLDEEPIRMPLPPERQRPGVGNWCDWGIRGQCAILLHYVETD